MKRRDRELEHWIRDAAPSTPPDGLKDSILSRAADTPQESVARSVPRKRSMYWKLAASFAMLALICSVTVSRLASPGNYDDCSYAPSQDDAVMGVEKNPLDESDGGGDAADVVDVVDVVDPVVDADVFFSGEDSIPSLDEMFVPGGDNTYPILNNNQPIPVPGLLTAGEWCDNLNFDFFTDVLQRQDWSDYPIRYQLTIARRIAVTVLNAQNEPLSNVPVVWVGANGQDVYRAVTDASGLAYLFAFSDDQAQGGTVTISLDGAEDSQPVASGEDTLRFVMDAPVRAAETLDLMFVIDTTGSMGDELSYLQAELEDVIRSVSDAHPNTRIRLSVNFYRDKGDAYLVLPFDFTENIRQSLADLAAQSAAGGGDNPEAVDVALANALNEHDWAEGSVRLCYLVCDAPPHSNQLNVVTQLQKLLPAFAANGVHLIPVASSGVDTEAEYFLRTAAALTGGTYTFLTNDSGIGGDHLEPTIGEYQVRPLNELLVEITSRYLG